VTKISLPAYLWSRIKKKGDRGCGASAAKVTSGYAPSGTSSFPEKYSPTARTATIFFYGGDTMRAQFIQIPVELLSDRRVSALELRLYAILLRYGLEGRGFSQAGHRLLANNCSCHPKTIARCLKNLQSIGWITIERVGLNRNSKIRCLKTVQRPKPEGTKGSYQVKTPGRPPTTTIDRRKKRYRRGRDGLTDVQETPLDYPNVQETPLDKPQKVASGYESAENREVGEQFKDAQQALLGREYPSSKPLLVPKCDNHRRYG